MMTEQNEYLIGIAKRDITPPVGIRMCGFAARTEASTGVYHPLRAVALAIDDGQTPVLIVGADILGFYDRCESVRQALCNALHMPAENIILAGSHTHCGPHIREFDRPRLGPPDIAYLDLLTQRIVEAAEDAWRSRSKAYLQVGMGQCSFAVSRRRRRPDGLVEWGVDRNGPHDHQVPVLTARRPSGEVFGIFYSYACHPTSRGGLLIGGDYVSFTHDRIEAQFPDAIVGFVQGCGADQKPLPVDPEERTFVQREVSEVKLLGDELGDAVIEVVAGDGMREVSGEMVMASRIIKLKSIAPDVEDAKLVLAGGDKRLYAWAERIIKAVEDGVELERQTSFEIQTLTFGRSLAIVTLAGEITVEHGLRLKRDLGGAFDHVVVMGYTNHIVGYVPVRRQIPEGGYCVEWANKFHGRTGRWEDDTEDRIHAEVRGML